MRHVVFLCIISVGALFSAQSSASTFTLAEGERYEICRAYEGNLKFFSASLTLNTKIFPLLRLKDFRQPRWQHLDAGANLDLIRKFYLWTDDPTSLASATDAPSKWETEAPMVMDEIKSEMIKLEFSRFDFDNDGHIDDVYRLYHPVRYAGWKPDNPTQIYGYWFIYLNGVNSRVSEGFRAFSGENRLYDALMFKGRTFLIGWLTGELEIFEPSVASSKITLTPVCFFHYAP
jgi:hypothetical protein